MRLHLAILSTTLLLGACQTVQDQSIPISQDFSQTSTQFNIKRPTWRLSDSVYQQQLQSQRDNYVINGTETGWGKSERSQLWFSESGGLLDGFEFKDKFLRILFLDLLDMRRKTQSRYALQTENDFAFTVNANQIDATKVKCRLLSMSDQLETVYKMGDNKTRKNENTSRLSSYLGCDLQQGNQHWYFAVNTMQKDSPLIKLQLSEHKMEEQIAFKLIRESSYLVNGQWRTMPNNFQQFSGLQIQWGMQDVGAVSFEGQSPKIWIGKNIPEERKALVIAMSYSVMMYDWLDSGWRSSH